MNVGHVIEARLASASEINFKAGDFLNQKNFRHMLRFLLQSNFVLASFACLLWQ